jgi:hypothetical protein
MTDKELLLDKLLKEFVELRERIYKLEDEIEENKKPKELKMWIE